MTTALLLALVSGTALLAAGITLSASAEALAVRTGLGRVWIGTVLLASATSLPELATDVAAVRLGAPDLGAGDVFGSSMANMAILAVLGLMRPAGRVFRGVALRHTLTGALAIALTALAAILVLVRPTSVVAGVSPGSIALVLGFLAGMRVLYEDGRISGPESPAPEPDAPGPEVPGLRSALVRFGLAAAAILVAAPRFTGAAERIAEITGLGDTFVGTTVVGITTSLPELISSVAAVRMGAFDLAVANLFGSNCFNMVIFAAMDLAAPGASVFADLSPTHALTGLFALILMGLGIATIVYRGARRPGIVEPGSVLMLVVYAAALWTLGTR